jgi:hypothetical protein
VVEVALVGAAVVAFRVTVEFGPVVVVVALVGAVTVEVLHPLGLWMTLIHIFWRPTQRL